MRLENFLNENEANLEEYWSTIKKDCKPFLTQLRNCEKGSLLFRGSSILSNFFRQSIRKNRMPSDTASVLTELFDKEFYKKFKLKPRSQGLFCAGSRDYASFYGPVSIVFPIGSYKFLWSTKAKDLFLSVVEGGLGMDWIYLDPVEYKNEVEEYLEQDYNDINKKDRIEYTEYKERRIKEIQKEVKEIVKKIVDTYKTTNLCEAINSKNEIAIICDECYQINEKWKKDIINLIWE